MSITGSMTPTTPLSIGELEQRYDITRNAIRNRIDGLGIKPQQDGRSRVVSVADVLLLDELDVHLKDGGTVSSFLRSKGMAIATVEDSPTDDVNHSVSDTGNGLALATTPQAGDLPVDLLLNAIAAVAQSRPSSPIERYEFLSRAAADAWQVTTADLRWATGQSTIKPGQWRGYTFERAARGVWRVHRVEASKPKKGKS